MVSHVLDVERLLTIREASALVHVHSSTLRRWEKSGLLRPYRVGPRGDRRYSRAQLLAFLNGNSPADAPDINLTEVG